MYRGVGSDDIRAASKCTVMIPNASLLVQVMNTTIKYDKCH